MKQLALSLVAVVWLAGCDSLAKMNQTMLQQGRPIAMYTLPDCAGYVVQSGMVVPVGQRMEALDQICLALTRQKPAAAAEPASAASK